MIDEWVEQCRQGQTRAFAEIVKTLQPGLLGFLFRMTQDRELAEDLGQEAFLRAFRQIHRYNGKKAAFPTWLFTLARNLCLDELRKHRPKWASLEEAAEIEQKGVLAPDGEAGERELERRIAHAVAELEPVYREVFVLREYENLSLEEVAEIIDCPLGTVKSRLHRARTLLQEELAPILAG